MINAIMNTQRIIKVTKFEQLHDIPTTANRVGDNEIRFDFMSPNLIVFDLSSITAMKEGDSVNLYSPAILNPLGKGEVFEQLKSWADELFQHSK